MIQEELLGGYLAVIEAPIMALAEFFHAQTSLAFHALAILVRLLHVETLI